MLLRSLLVKKRCFKERGNRHLSLYIFGDSITNGNYGIGYKEYLSEHYVTKGYDGATLGKILTFSHAHLRKIEHNNVKIVYQGGANDLLFTYFSHFSNGWSSYIKKKEAIEDSIEQWKISIEKKVKTIQTTYPSFTLYLCTIAIEASFSHSEIMSLTVEYNKAIKEIAAHLSIGVVDLFASFSSLLEDKVVGDYIAPGEDSLRLDAKYINKDEDKAASLSESRNLVLSVDGLHPNKKGATCIAKTIMDEVFI
ncbi:MAG: SGNH/GDSL hydrolase family protein [Spirochaetia bacterium]|nr:SGNH/GDSL hydrolase family protein [Spirochaetia bacterium]